MGVVRFLPWWWSFWRWKLSKYITRTPPACRPIFFLPTTLQIKSPCPHLRYRSNSLSPTVHQSFWLRTSLSNFVMQISLEWLTIEFRWSQVPWQQSPSCSKLLIHRMMSTVACSTSAWKFGYWEQNVRVSKMLRPLVVDAGKVSRSYLRWIGSSHDDRTV